MKTAITICFVGALVSGLAWMFLSPGGGSLQNGHRRESEFAKTFSSLYRPDARPTLSSVLSSYKLRTGQDLVSESLRYFADKLPPVALPGYVILYELQTEKGGLLNLELGCARVAVKSDSNDHALLVLHSALWAHRQRLGVFPEKISELRDDCGYVIDRMWMQEFSRSYYYSKSGGAYVLVGLGQDGIRSADDIVIPIVLLKECDEQSVRDMFMFLLVAISQE